jgi:outer membrane biogenesis lipoprotein LolB
VSRAAAFVRLIPLALALASGCAAPGVVPEVLTESALASPAERARVEGWLVSLREEMAARRSVRATGKLRVESERGGGSTRAVIVAERPDRLRLETLNLLGQTQTLLVVDGENFAFFEGRSIERGLTDPDVLRFRLGLDLQPLEAVALLLAAPDLPEGAPEQVWIAGEERRAEFATHTVSFSADGELRRVSVREPGGPERWTADFADWQPAGDGRFPGSLSFEFPETGVRAELRVEAAQLNLELEPRLFRAGEGPG